jgi:DNA-binding response OmpR family regulator
VDRSRPPERSIRVVVVDADLDSRVMYARYFALAGIRATPVRTADGALRVLRRHNHDAVITCLHLPGTDGIALCRAIRALSSRPLPVIGLSTSAPDHQRAVLSGQFTTVLMKPCLPATLLDSLRAALSGDHDRRPSPLELS